MIKRGMMKRWMLCTVAALLLAGCGSSQPVGDGSSGGTPPPSPTPTPTPPPASFVAVPFVSAHRGGAAYAPENTMMAYRNAARLGVDDFETDMVLTSDGIAVLLHDTTLDRTTDCTGTVSDKTYAEISACDAGYWWSPGQSTTSPDEAREHPLRGYGVRIPTAEELFAFTAGFTGTYAPTVTIEIKIQLNDPLGVQAAGVLVPLIQNSGIAERIIVQSFNPFAVQTIKAMDPTIQTLFLSSTGATYALTVAVAGGHDYVAPVFDSPDLNAEFVTSAHAAGKRVDPWTPDAQDDIQAMIDLGVDGIITNYPGCLMTLQDRLYTDRLYPADAPAVELSLCK